MNYKELVTYLLNKYGPSKYDYFHNNTYKTKNKKVTRTQDGLFCHHIDEDKAEDLSNPKLAMQYPYEYQKADRLVYCNYLEHLLLHIQIGEEKFWKTHKELKYPIQFASFIVPGVSFISKNIMEDRTRTQIKLLQETEVIEEIARISSGEVNEVTLKYARELRNKKAS